MYVEVTIDLPDGDQNYVLFSVDASVTPCDGFHEVYDVEVYAYEPVAVLIGTETSWRPATEAEFAEAFVGLGADEIIEAINHHGRLNPHACKLWMQCPQLAELKPCL